MMTRMNLSIATVALLMCSTAQDTRPTLRDIARQVTPAPVYQTRQRELYVQALEDLIPKAEVVLHGSVTASQSSLSPDERDIFTAYTIDPVRVLHDRSNQVARQAGRPTTISLKRWGGQVMIDGVSVTQQDMDLPQFRVGDELVLLLVSDKSDRTFRLVGDISGAFRISQGRVEPLVAHPASERLRGMSIDDLQALTNKLAR